MGHLLASFNRMGPGHTAMVQRKWLCLARISVLTRLICLTGNSVFEHILHNYYTDTKSTHIDNQRTHSQHALCTHTYMYMYMYLGEELGLAIYMYRYIAHGHVCSAHTPSSTAEEALCPVNQTGS